MPMTPSLLAEAGKLLHGEQWKAPLARELGVPEKTVARWASGYSTIPPGVTEDIVKLLQERRRGFHDLIRRIAGIDDDPPPVPVIGHKVE